MTCVLYSCLVIFDCLHFFLSLIDTIKWRLIHYVDALCGSSCCRKNVHQSQKAIWKGKGQTRVEPKETPSSKLKSWLLFECCLLRCWPHTNSMDHNSSCVILYVLSNCLVNCTYVWQGVQEYILHVWWNGTDQKMFFLLFLFWWNKILIFLAWGLSSGTSDADTLEIWQWSFQ